MTAIPSYPILAWCRMEIAVSFGSLLVGLLAADAFATWQDLLIHLQLASAEGISMIKQQGDAMLGHSWRQLWLRVHHSAGACRALATRRTVEIQGRSQPIPRWLPVGSPILLQVITSDEQKASQGLDADPGSVCWLSCQAECQNSDEIIACLGVSLPFAQRLGRTATCR